MALIIKLRKPDIFCIFKCNQKLESRWELTENMNPGTAASNTTDLVSEIFHTQLNASMNNITGGERFG